jgi:hypothetical protein
MFGAIDSWNVAHPDQRGARRERGSINVSQVYTDRTGEPSYAITVVCTLAGSMPFAFHGQGLAAVVEQARLTLERKIAAELDRRAARARETDVCGDQDVA